MRPPCLADRFLSAWGRRRWRGFHKLRRILHRPVFEVATLYGAVFALQPEDHIDGIILHNGFYEPEVFTALQSFLTPGAVFWDIGANFGLHAVSAALTVPGVQVHAFEPNPAMLARLETHARRNGVDFQCWPCALADRNGTGTLHIAACGNPGMTTITPWKEASYSGRIEARLARADTLIDQGKVPAPNVVKLDVEGAEALVLAGFGERLHDPELRAVVFETWADLLDDPARCPAAIQLHAAGFCFQALPRRSPGSSHALGNFLAYRPT